MHKHVSLKKAYISLSGLISIAKAAEKFLYVNYVCRAQSYNILTASCASFSLVLNRERSILDFKKQSNNGLQSHRASVNSVEVLCKVGKRIQLNWMICLPV